MIFVKLLLMLAVLLPVAITTQMSNVRKPAVIKGISWLQQRVVNVIVAISIQKATRKTTINARPDAVLGHHAMDHRVAAVDQARIP